VTRDQPQPGSFLNKREEPGNEVGFEIDVSAAAIMKRFEQISDEDLKIN
jgi:hypothetical protein